MRRSKAELPRWPDVDIWLAEHRAEQELPDRYRALLGATERDRADRFSQARLRAAFIARRAWQRMVLAQYLGCSPQQVAIAQEEGTKPRLEPGPEPCPCFSVSHSGPFWMMAVSDREIGLDIECPRKILDPEGLSRRVCSRSERAHLASLDPAGWSRHFFKLWTVKEAVAKLTGEGLHAPFHEIDTGGQAQPQQARYQGRQVYLSEPSVAVPGLFATLACYSPGAALRLRQLAGLPDI